MIKSIAKKVFILSFILISTSLLLFGCSDTEEPKDTEQEKVNVSFDYNGEMYSTKLKMPLEDNYYELTVLEKYTDNIISTIEQFKQVKDKKDYENLTIFFLSDKGEFVDKNGNKNEEPKNYGWIKLTKDEINNINIDYYKDNPLMLFDNYAYNTVGLKK